METLPVPPQDTQVTGLKNPDMRFPVPLQGEQRPETTPVPEQLVQLTWVVFGFFPPLPKGQAKAGPMLMQVAHSRMTMILKKRCKGAS